MQRVYDVIFADKCQATVFIYKYCRRPNENGGDSQILIVFDTVRPSYTQEVPEAGQQQIKLMENVLSLDIRTTHWIH